MLACELPHLCPPAPRRGIQSRTKERLMPSNELEPPTNNHHPSTPEANEGATHEITVREAGRRGGRSTRERHGPEHYQQIGKKGGQALAEERGSDYYSELGKKGGGTVLERHGSLYYSQIGKKGGKALKMRAD